MRTDRTGQDANHIYPLKFVFTRLTRIPMSIREQIPPTIGKADAVRALADRIALKDVAPWGPNVPAHLQAISSEIGHLNNLDIDLVDAANLPGLSNTLHFATADRKLSSPIYLNGRPGCFPEAGADNAFATTFNVLTVRNGYISHFAGGPFILASDGRTIIKDYSSRYAGLVHFYSTPMRKCIEDARYIDGLVIPIADDVRPLNYCHWLVDWLPRLAFIGMQARRRDVYVVTTPLMAQFQRESLVKCGFDESRIIGLTDFETIRARDLLVPSDFFDFDYHPAHKAAPWAISYLRSMLGMNSILSGKKHDISVGKKIYISRRDADRRFIVNENDLIDVLTDFGYTTVTLSDAPLSEQISIFANASHIVSLHGAGLANFLFCSHDTSLLEIFPHTYGTPSFYVIAAGVENTYRTYVANEISAGERAQADDIFIDLRDFKEKCSPYL